jgi:hypothetical protein
MCTSRCFGLVLTEREHDLRFSQSRIGDLRERMDAAARVGIPDRPIKRSAVD